MKGEPDTVEDEGRALEPMMPFATAAQLLARRPRPLVTISPESGAGAAARLMKEHDIGFLPVVEGDRLVGVLSERDMVRGVSVQRPTFVREIMKAPIHTIAPEADVHECLTVMHRERIRHLPVASGGVIHGVLSVWDLAGSLLERHERLLRRP